MGEDKMTTVSIKTSTRVALESMALKGETYDKVLNDLLKLAKKQEYLYKKIREQAKRG